MYATALPILDSNGNKPFYGSEFQNLYNSQLRSDLQNPTVIARDYDTGEKYTLYDGTGGIYNQSLIYENNDDANEDQRYTYGQARENVLRSFDGARNLNADEKAVNLYTDNSYDPKFRQALVEESVKNGSNIFSTTSQDFVREVQESNLSYNRNDNLYSLYPDKQKQIQQLVNMGSIGRFGTNTTSMAGAVDAGLSGLFGMAREEQMKQKKQQSFRERYAPKGTQTLNEKFMGRTSGIY